MTSSDSSWAIITGASSGLGKAYAEILTKQGYNLLCIGRHSERLEELKKTLSEKHNREIECLSLDLCQKQAMDTLLQTLKQKNRQIDILINNAGVGLHGSFESLEISTIENMIELNAKVPLRLCHAIVPIFLKQQKQAYILNVGSLAGIHASHNVGLYGASKAFLKDLSSSLARQYKQRNISVTYAAPGAINTDFFKNANFNISESEQNAYSSAESIAKISLEAMFQKKELVVPETKNKIRYLILRFAPNFILNKIIP